MAGSGAVGTVAWGTAADCTGTRVAAAGGAAGASPVPGVSPAPAAAPAPASSAALGGATAGAPVSAGALVAGIAALATGASAAAPPASCWARLTANLSISREPTSAMTPRPNCAGRPVTFSVVCIVTRVDSSPEPFSGLSAARTVADAVPAPRISLPDASTRIDRSAASRSLNEAIPL